MARAGLRPRDWVEEIALRHKMKVGSVWSDWGRRKTWMRQLLQLDDAEALALEILYDYDQILIDAKKLSKTTENPYAKIAALKLALNANQLKHDFLEKMGALETLKIGFKKAEDLGEQYFLEKYPCFKGDRERFVRNWALSKVKEAKSMRAI